MDDSLPRLRNAALFADLVSYGFGLAAVVAALQFQVAFSLPQAVAIMVIYVGMRGVARDVRRQARRQQRPGRSFART